MSAAAGRDEPERNFLFARTPEIPGGARPRRCADNTNAAVARSHRLCPFASRPLARSRDALAPSHPPRPASRGDGRPAPPASPRADLLVAPTLARATIDRALARNDRGASPTTGTSTSTSTSTSLGLVDDPGRDDRAPSSGRRRRRPGDREDQGDVARPDRSEKRGPNLRDRAASRSRARASGRLPRAPAVHPRSRPLSRRRLSLSLSLSPRFPHYALSSPPHSRSLPHTLPPQRPLAPTLPVALFVVKLFMLYILKGTYQPPFR